jgi:hypothetical protein
LLVRWSLALLVPALVVGARPAAAVTADVEVHTPLLTLGALELRDVTVRVRERGKGHETCIHASIPPARITACGTLDTVRGQVMLRDGRATLVFPARDGETAKIARTTITARISGNLSTLDLSLTGTVKTARADLRSQLVSATLRGVTLPFAVRVKRVRGELTITEDAPLVVKLGGATLSAAEATIPIAPTIVLHAGWPRWRADITWAGLELAPALAAASGGRVAGTGRLAGELLFRGERADVTLVGGRALATGGQLRLADTALRERLAAAVNGKVAIQQRIGAALADFRYRRLSITIGDDPAARIELTGQGNRIPQVLDLTVNVRSKK